jgi:AcrR family transcriptional regulator
MSSMATRPRASRRRRPLNREHILGAALELVDEEGLDALTMRRLGQELGVEAMSLYNHVANKDDIIDGLLDLVLDEMELPTAGGEWDAAIRASAISVHDALRRHAWAAPLLMAPRIRPARLRLMEALLRRLREAGFSEETTYHAYHVIDGHTLGFSHWENSHSASRIQAENMNEMFDRYVPHDMYPYLRQHGEQHFAEGPHRDVSAFEYGLDLIVEGLRQIHGAPTS